MSAGVHPHRCAEVIDPYAASTAILKPVPDGGMWAEGCAPNPRPERISKNPIPSPERVPAQEDGPVLVFPGRSLGLGHGSRYFGGLKKSGTKRSTALPTATKL